MQYFVIETMPFGENCYILYDDISKQCAIIDPGGDFNKITDFIKLGDNVIDFIITSGHTAGSMCIKADNLLFTGDTLFAGSIGRTDLPTGSYQDMEKSLSKLSKMKDELLILPGHGTSSTIGYEKKYNPFMRGVN